MSAVSCRAMSCLAVTCRATIGDSSTSILARSYVRQEKVKRRSYEQRIRDVEHASFVPAMFSTTGCMGKHATALYKRIASILAEKTGEKYSAVMAAIRCRISFALLRSTIMCLKGSRRLFENVSALANLATLVVAEANPLS